MRKFLVASPNDSRSDFTNALKHNIYAALLIILFIYHQPTQKRRDNRRQFLALSDEDDFTLLQLFLLTSLRLIRHK